MSLSKEQRMKKLDSIKDKDIDYSDIPELDEDYLCSTMKIRDKKLRSYFCVFWRISNYNSSYLFNF